MGQSCSSSLVYGVCVLSLLTVCVCREKRETSKELCEAARGRRGSGAARRRRQQLVLRALSVRGDGDGAADSMRRGDRWCKDEAGDGAMPLVASCGAMPLGGDGGAMLPRRWCDTVTRRRGAMPLRRCTAARCRHSGRCDADGDGVMPSS